MGEKGKKILVGVDEGEESGYALSWCLQNLLSHSNSEDTLILLFAKTPLPIYSAIDSTAGYLFSQSIVATMDTYANQVADAVMQKASTLCSTFNHQAKVETMVEHGDPRDVICQVAERLKVDLLVLGSHGYGLIKRAFLGSVSQHCAQQVKCPVLIVKKPTN
uniref:Universal stress protein 24 n=1 Tax=Salvia miltiorrhiza TaxID=226208 RepID=A0A290YXT4_SALMI|nr:universal stress protein 24 [Salvia miltiorrhiza]